MTDEQQLAVVGAKFDLVPRNMTEAMEFAKMIASTSLVPKSYRDKETGKVNPGDILVAVQMGIEVGLKPLQAIQNIAVINGSPTIWGDGALGLVRSSGLLEDFEERNPSDALKAGGGWCKAKRKGQPTPIERTFTKADAETAGLASKQGPWQNYPGRMLQMRARSLVLRDGFTDVLKGLMVREEAQDIDKIEEAEYREITPPHAIGEPRVKPGQVDKMLEQTAPVAPAGKAGNGGDKKKATPKGAKTWTGALERITKSSGTKDGKDWQLYTIYAADSTQFKTFSLTEAETARDLIGNHQNAVVTYTVHPEHGNKLHSVARDEAAATEQEVPVQGEPGSKG